MDCRGSSLTILPDVHIEKPRPASCQLVTKPFSTTMTVGYRCCMESFLIPRGTFQVGWPLVQVSMNTFVAVAWAERRAMTCTDTNLCWLCTAF